MVNCLLLSLIFEINHQNLSFILVVVEEEVGYTQQCSGVSPGLCLGTIWGAGDGAWVRVGNASTLPAGLSLQPRLDIFNLRRI